MMPRLNPLFVVAFVSFSSSFPSSQIQKSVDFECSGIWKQTFLVIFLFK
jgi:hypothetical protein